ncbi:MAG: hypothetical protein EKK54_06230 [Neisseriaceae bacterium]|nr:MAG: hypothetical protein EKK54_06230 [Neisseriaceae bacterium]
MKKLIWTLPILAVFGCSSSKYPTPNQASLLPTNSNPHLQAGDIINVINYSHLGNSFSALIKTPISLQNNYVLPANIVISGECKNNNPIINKIDHQPINIEIATKTKSGYSLSCNDTNIKLLMVIADADLPMKILTQIVTPFRPIKYESSGYDFQVKQVLSNNWQYKIIIAKQDDLPVIFENDGSNVTLTNFRAIESGTFHTYLVDTNTPKLTLMFNGHREDIIVYK